MVNSKEYTPSYAQGTLRVSQNSSVHNEKSTTSVSAWGHDGRLLANWSFSEKDTKALIAHLQEIVADNAALKPKEPSVMDKIAALPIGTVFSRTSDAYAKYIKSPTGQLQSLTEGYRYPLSDYEPWKTLHVHYDPTK